MNATKARDLAKTSFRVIDNS